MHSVKGLVQASALSHFVTDLLQELQTLGWFKPLTSDTFGSQRQLRGAACAWACSAAAVQAAAGAVSLHLTSSPVDHHASPSQIQPNPSLTRNAVLAAGKAHVEWCASSQGREALAHAKDEKEAASLLHQKNRLSFQARSSADAEDDDSKSVRSEDSSTNASDSSKGVGRSSQRGYVVHGTFACNLCFKVDHSGRHVPLGRRCRTEIRRMADAAGGDTSGIAEGWEALQRWYDAEKKKKSASKRAPSETAPFAAAAATAGSCSFCCRPRASTTLGKSKRVCGKPGSDRCLELFLKHGPSRLPGSDDRAEPIQDIMNVLTVQEDELLDFLGIQRGFSTSHSKRFTRAKRPVVIFGGPGTGKSFTVLRLVQVLRAILGVAQVPLVAAYGLVAQNVGGVTLHSWAGIGPCDDAHARGPKCVGCSVWVG